MKKYLLNLCKAITVFFKSLGGVAVPTAYIYRTWSKFATVNYEDLQAALVKSSELMQAQGWTKEVYQHGTMNCTTFCMKRLAEVVKLLEESKDYQDRLPLTLFGYTRKDRMKHVVIRANVGDKVYFFEGFAGYNDPVIMTKEEIESRNFDFG